MTVYDDIFPATQREPLELPDFAAMRADERVRMMSRMPQAEQAELIQMLIFDANAARRAGEREYKCYVRSCVGAADGNLITLF